MPRVDAASCERRPRQAAGTSARLWTTAILVMGLCVVATAWFPLAAITALPSQNYNEGWNAYRQWLAAKGQPLYASHPSLWTTNYPFLSFHIIGCLGVAKGNMVVTGRILCFAALVTTAICIGGIVWTVAGSRAGALYAGLCLFAWIASFYGAGRAADDPELLSLMFTGFGLLAYLKTPQRGVWLGLAASAFALSLFTKHDLIAFPLSAAASLLLTRDWRGFAVFTGAGMLAAALLLGLSDQFDGRYFLRELLQPRAYSLTNLGDETRHYLVHFLVPLALGLVLLRRQRALPQRRFFVILLILSHVIAVYFSGGDGVAANIFYPPLIAVLLTCVIAICQFDREVQNAARASRSFQSALLICTVAGAVMVPFRVHDDIAAALRLPAATRAAQLAIAQLAAASGPAICEDLLLCYQAGKPLDYDAYYVNDQIRLGRLPERQVLALLNDHHYAVIQINGLIDSDSVAHAKGGRFSQSFLRTLLAAYRPVLTNQSDSVFVPAMAPPGD